MSNYFAIMPDVNSDLNDFFQKEYDLDIIHGHYTTPDGKEHPSVLNWNTLDRDQFYKDLKKDPNGYKTSPGNVEECFEAFEKHVKKGEPIIAISISQALSGSYSFMSQAKELIL